MERIRQPEAVLLRCAGRIQPFTQNRHPVFLAAHSNPAGGFGFTGCGQSRQIADAYAAKYDFVRVVHTKPPHAGKGKSGALNQGLRQATGEIIVVYDADNTPERKAVYYLALALQNDPQAGVVVGKFRVINATRNLLTRFINIETICFQWMAQAGRHHWFHVTTIPGTNFAIRKSLLEKLGGWDEKALAEDTELTIRVYNEGYTIRFFPAAITWEQEPENLPYGLYTAVPSLPADRCSLGAVRCSLGAVRLRTPSTRNGCPEHTCCKNARGRERPICAGDRCRSHMATGRSGLIAHSRCRGPAE